MNPDHFTLANKAHQFLKPSVTDSVSNIAADVALAESDASRGFD